MKQHFVDVVANAELDLDTRLLRVRGPEIARHATPGQFVHVRCASQADPLLRRPFSISQVAIPESKGDEFALLIKLVGRGSTMLAGVQPGDRLDVLGPLGRGFRLPARARQILLLAGGAGIAPLLALARQALERDVAVTLLFGCKSAAKVFPAHLIPPQVEYVVLTEDGSFGRKGVVTAALRDYWDSADQIFACGPTPMLRALAQMWQQRGATSSLAQVSLEQHMACGLGACYGCAIETAQGNRRVCRDGPVFDIEGLQW